MKLLILIFCTLIFSGLHGQEINQDINTITIKGVSFNQIINHLQKSGYSIETLDNKRKTVRTKFFRYSSKTSSLDISIKVQFHDSIAVITGRMCYNFKNNGKDTLPDLARSQPVRYTYGSYKEAFLLMNDFAKSFNSEMIYSKSD